jgi:uncharacterized OB-fold protein
MEIDTAGYWEGCRAHELRIQRCTRCKTYRHTPAPVCYECHSFEHEYVTSNGVGEVYTYTIIHHAVIPLVAQLVPYNAVVVQLLDCGGAKIMSNLVDVPNDEITIGMRVEVTWDDVSPEISLPRFRRSTVAGGGSRR